MREPEEGDDVLYVLAAAPILMGCLFVYRKFVSPDEYALRIAKRLNASRCREMTFEDIPEHEYEARMGRIDRLLECVE